MLPALRGSRRGVTGRALGGRLADLEPALNGQTEEEDQDAGEEGLDSGDEVQTQLRRLDPCRTAL